MIILLIKTIFYSFIWLYFCLIFSDIVVGEEAYFGDLPPLSRVLPFVLFLIVYFGYNMDKYVATTIDISRDNPFWYLILLVFNLFLIFVILYGLISESFNPKTGWIIRLPLFLLFSIIQIVLIYLTFGNIFIIIWIIITMIVIEISIIPILPTKIENIYSK